MFLRLTGVLAAALVVAGLWFYFVMDHFINSPLTIEQNGLHHVIEPKSSLGQFADDLARRGVLKEPRYLIWLARWRDNDQAIKAGEYRFAAGTTPAMLLDQIVSGDVVLNSLTFIEGWTFKQMIEAMNSEKKLKQTLAGLSDEQIMARLGWPGIHPEGRFYPDSYHFSTGMTDAAFLQRAYRTMEKRLAAEWSERQEGLPLKTADEALVLASIVEKETGVPAERPEIAGVFIRRLRQGMRLQIDPTVIYGLGDAFDGNLRRRDLRADTPYNTYTRGGLPPTPIAMPGGDAIHAAVHPAEGDTLYFVSRGDGSHQFSATLAEHNRAVRKYQLKRAPAQSSR